MARLYDLANVVCTVGGVPLSNYGADDAVAVEWGADLVSTMVTVDGPLLYVRTRQSDALATVTLMSTSKAVPLLRAVLEGQHGLVGGLRPSVIVPVPFWLTDAVTGDHVSGAAVFLNRPGLSKGKEVGEVVFRLSLSNPSVQLGVFNLL